MKFDMLGEAACENAMYYMDLLGDLLKLYISLLKFEED